MHVQWGDIPFQYHLTSGAADTFRTCIFAFLKKFGVTSSGDLLSLYARLIAKYRILLFNGDTDAFVPYWGIEQVQAATYPWPQHSLVSYLFLTAVDERNGI